MLKNYNQTLVHSKLLIKQKIERHEQCGTIYVTYKYKFSGLHSEKEFWIKLRHFIMNFYAMKNGYLYLYQSQKEIYGIS